VSVACKAGVEGLLENAQNRKPENPRYPMNNEAFAGLRKKEWQWTWK
jgi:hypothetical protein